MSSTTSQSPVPGAFTRLLQAQETLFSTSQTVTNNMASLPQDSDTKYKGTQQVQDTQMDSNHQEDTRGLQDKISSIEEWKSLLTVIITPEDRPSLMVQILDTEAATKQALAGNLEQNNGKLRAMVEELQQSLRAAVGKLEQQAVAMKYSDTIIQIQQHQLQQL